jgi:hypothetical protein
MSLTNVSPFLWKTAAPDSGVILLFFRWSNDVLSNQTKLIVEELSFALALKGVCLRKIGLCITHELVERRYDGDGTVIFLVVAVSTSGKVCLRLTNVRKGNPSSTHQAPS